MEINDCKFPGFQKLLKLRKVKDNSVQFSLVQSLSHVRLFATLWTVAHQAPPSMGFSRQEYWSGLPFPSPGDLPDPGIEPRSPTLQADALTSEPPGKPEGWKRECKYESNVWMLGSSVWAVVKTGLTEGACHFAL